MTEDENVAPDLPDTAIEVDLGMVPVITLLSDRGLRDTWAGLAHSILYQLCPVGRVVDLTHELTPGDTRSAGLLLARSANYLAPGVIVAAVADQRAETRAIAVRAAGIHLVGFDNGSLAPLVALLGGPEVAVILDNDELHLPSPGVQDPARDVLIPAAGHLAAGGTIEELGSRVEPAELQPAVVPIPNEVDGVLRCTALWTDRQHRVQLNLDADELPAPGTSVVFTSGGRTARAIVTSGRASNDVAAPTGPLLGPDAFGMAVLYTMGSSIAEEYGIAEGDEVGLDLSAAPPEESPSAEVVPVSVRRSKPNGPQPGSVS